MPGFDGTGPRGMGPMTGGARGFCNPYYAQGRAPFGGAYPSGTPYGPGYAPSYGGYYSPYAANTPYQTNPYGSFGFGRRFRMGRGFGGGNGFGWGRGMGRRGW